MSGSNLSKSVHQRLLRRAKDTGRPFNELLQYYAMERFLYRLAQSRYSDTFVLKGALVFIVWDIPGMTARPTRDIDLLGIIDNSPDSMKRVFSEICRTAVEDDGIVYNSDDIDISPITEEADYIGQRIKLNGNLGNARITLQVDVGFGDSIVPPAEKRTYPSILGFPSPDVKVYSAESVIAEKLQAMVKLGIINSRMKDFHDIRVMSEVFHFNGILLSDSIRSTFQNRNTDIPIEPLFFQNSFRTDLKKLVQWKAFHRKTGLEDNASDFDTTIDTLETFIIPVLQSIAENIPFAYTWKPRGPWKPAR